MAQDQVCPQCGADVSATGGICAACAASEASAPAVGAPTVGAPATSGSAAPHLAGRLVLLAINGILLLVFVSLTAFNIFDPPRRSTPSQPIVTATPTATDISYLPFATIPATKTPKATHTAAPNIPPPAQPTATSTPIPKPMPTATPDPIPSPTPTVGTSGG